MNERIVTYLLLAGKAVLVLMLLSFNVGSLVYLDAPTRDFTCGEN
jgi:hypothetical protein